MPLPIALIDTHSHIYAEEFDADRDEAIRRAREAGVERLACCCRRSTPRATGASSTPCAAIRTTAPR